MIAGTTDEMKNSSTCSPLWRSLAPFDQLSAVNRSLANFGGPKDTGKMVYRSVSETVLGHLYRGVTARGLLRIIPKPQE
jgi:hypothetical protein